MAISDISINDKTYNIIHELFLFRGVDDIVFEKAMSGDSFHLNKYMPGEIIYEPSRFEHALGVIITGSAKIATADGIKNIILRTLGVGSVFGAASLFGDDNEYVTQITAKGTTTAAFFTQAAISEIINADRGAALNYIIFLSDRIRFLNHKITSFTAGSAESRLARYLGGLTETAGAVSLPSGFKLLAESLDIGRASLYRAFDTLELNGCIKRDGRKVYILSRETLNKI